MLGVVLLYSVLGFGLDPDARIVEEPLYLLRFLGAPSLQGPGGYVTGKAVQPRQMAVLAVLATAGEEGVTRDKLTGLLWPEVPDEKARHALRDALYLLRGRLGESAIERSGGLVRINCNHLWADVVAFRDAIVAGELEAAAKLYRGPFLDGFYSRHGVDFESWVDATRKQLAMQYEGVTLSLAHKAEEREDHAAAVTWWRCLVAQDPLNTRFATGLVKALAADGDPGNAMLELHEHEGLLREEFDLPISPELKALETALSREWPNETEIPSFVGASSARISRSSYRSDLVVVAPLTNRTGDTALDVYGTLVSDWISHGVKQSGIANVVPALTVQRLWKDLDDTESPQDPVQFLAERTGAAWIVHGGYYLLGDSIRFQADLSDVNLGTAGVGVEPAVSSLDDPLVAVGRLSDRVLGALAASIEPLGAIRKGLMTAPPSLDVYRAWREGEEAFLRQKWDDALGHFHRAWSMDTTFVTPLVRSGWPLAILERYEDLDRVLARVRQERQNLSPLESLQIDWFEAFRERDLEGQARIGGRLAALTPTDWSFNAGTSAMRIGRLGDAIRHLTQLDPSTSFDDGVIARMYLARAQHLRGDFLAELQTARQARQQHPGRLAPWEGEVRALVAAGRMAEADGLVENQVILPVPYPELPPISVVWPTAGSLLTYLALEARAHGQADAFRRWVEGAIAWHREQMAEDAGIDPMGLIQALYYGERWDEAVHHLGGITRSEDPRDVESLGFSAVLAVRLGDPDRVESLDQALASLDAFELSGANLVWRARIAALQGQKRRAVELLHRAYRKGWPFNIWYHVEPDFAPLSDYSPFKEFLAPKG